jgi:hypothetical protein
MRTGLTAAAVVAASSLLAMPALDPAASAAPAVAESHEGTLTVCVAGLGRHGKINAGESVEFLESHRAISSASLGYSRPREKCSTESVSELTRFSLYYRAKSPYHLRAVRSTQTDGSDARVTVTRRLGVRLLMDEGDDVKVTMVFKRK